MYPYLPNSPQPAQTVSDSVPSELPTFLTDWLRDHRDLSPESRRHAGRYIEAVVAQDIRTGRLQENEAPIRAARLWQTFRLSYDSMRGAYGKTDREDVARALSRI